MTRKSISPDIQERILCESRRRCAFCFGLNNDLNRKKGQIAHIDRNSSNSSEENLAFLCLEHHDEYDSKPSQSKGLTPRELTQYQKELIAMLTAKWLDEGAQDTQPTRPLPVINITVNNMGGTGGSSVYGGAGGGGGAPGGAGGGGGHSGQKSTKP